MSLSKSKNKILKNQQILNINILHRLVTVHCTTGGGEGPGPEGGDQGVQASHQLHARVSSQQGKGSLVATDKNVQLQQI